MSSLYGTIILAAALNQLDANANKPVIYVDQFAHNAIDLCTHAQNPQTANKCINAVLRMKDAETPDSFIAATQSFAKALKTMKEENK